MGVRVRYAVSGFTRESARSLLARSDATILMEHRFSVAPRLLVAIVMPDEPGILQQVLKVLHSNTKANANLSENSFSIEGSVTSAAAGSYLMVFLLRVLISDSKSRIDLREVASRLEGALSDELRPRARRAGESNDDWVRVTPFEVEKDGLFERMKFAEYRFRVKGFTDAARRAMGKALSEFAEAAGGRRIPIAYTYFPALLARGRGDELEQRIAIASPSSMTSTLVMDWEAIRIANTHHMGLAKYHPDLSVESMDARFLDLIDHSEGGDFFKGEDMDPFTPSCAVFVTAPARAGLVAQMLASGVGERLKGGTMTVLGGHTVACWVCPVEAADQLEQQIRENCSDASVFGMRIPGREESGPRNVMGVWLSWKVPDGAGVFLELVRSFEEAVRVRLKGSVRVDYAYSITRVLHDGSCAGKVRCRLVGDKPISEKDLVRDDLYQLMVASGWWVREYGQRISTGGATLSVSREEPGEEPWAALVPIFA